MQRVSAFISFSNSFVAPWALASFLWLDPVFAAAVPGQSPAPPAAASLEQAEALADQGDLKAAIAIYEQLQAASQPVFIRRGALGALLRLDPGGAEQRIVDILRGRDSALKPVAIAEITTLPPPDASKKFGQELPRLQPDEQVWLIQALAGRGDADARAAIRAAVNSLSVTVRLAAIGAVGDLDDASAVPLLVSALASARDPAERRKLEFALASLKGGAETDQAMLAELKTAGTDAKRILISALVRRRSRAAVPALLEEAGGAEAAVVSAAFEALGKLATAREAPALLNKLVNLETPEARADAENAATELLLRFDDRTLRADVVFACLVRTADTEARASLVRLLPVCGDERALAAVNAARQDSEPLLRETALRALTDWPTAAAWDALMEIYRQPDGESRHVLVLRALARLIGEDNERPDAALIARYRQLFGGTRSDGDRKLILGALSGVAHPDALPLALALLTNAEVRPEAALAVKKIADAIKEKNPQAAQAALERLK